jgi:hypothetical protein
MAFRPLVIIKVNVPHVERFLGRDRPSAGQEPPALLYDSMANWAAPLNGLLPAEPWHHPLSSG